MPEVLRLDGRSRLENVNVRPNEHGQVENEKDPVEGVYKGSRAVVSELDN